MVSAIFAGKLASVPMAIRFRAGRMGGAIAMAALLTGCAPFGASGPEIYRDADAPLGATTRFEARDFAGEWVVVASFGPIREGAVVFTHDQVDQTMTLTSDVIPDHAGVYTLAKTGVLTDRSQAENSLVVMWVDESFRTAAIGTISGDFGAVLNRSSDTPGDRAAAAREVLAFYGWDISQLKRTLP